jgi:hypothetical protein
MSQALRFIVAAALLAIAAPSRAASLAQYSFDGGSLASSDTDPNTVASALALSATSAVGSNGNPAPGLNVLMAYNVSGFANRAEALTINLTPTGAAELSLASLQLDGSRQYVQQAVPTAAFHVVLRSNLDGFASDVASASWNASNSTPDFVTPVLSLASPAFQDLSASDLAGVGGSLQLRLYFAMTNLSDLASISFIDNVAVNGSTVVPEPATGALLALGLLGVASVARSDRARAGGSRPVL